MPSTYTLNNGIELIGTGEQSGSWGDTTNTNFELIDTALDGQVTVTLASAGTSGSPNALPISDGASSDGRNRMIIFNDGADLGATAYVQLTPNDAEKIVYIRNALSGSRSIIVFQGTYSASNDYEIPAGTTAVIYFNGGGTGAVAANVFNNAYFDSLRLGGVSVTAIIDDDTMATAAATNIPTAESVKAYVDAQVGANNELSEVLANGNTTGGTSISVNSTDNILFGDNNKAIFGAGSDLQIYHDGFNSIIKDGGTGNLSIQATNWNVYNAAGTKPYIIANDGADTKLYYDGGLKLATTSTGVDVTGTAVSDGLTVEGPASILSGSSGGTAASNADELVIESAGDGGLSILTPGTNTGTLFFGDAVAGNMGQIKYSHSADSMSFVTAQNTAVTLDNNQRVLIGHTASVSFNTYLQLTGDNFNKTAVSLTRYSNNASATHFLGFKSRSTTVGTPGGIVADNDNLLIIRAYGDDGEVETNPAADIKFVVDGTPGVDDMPGRIEFATSPDGTNATVERVRIDSDGLFTAYYNMKATRNVYGGYTALTLENSNVNAGVINYVDLDMNAGTTGAAKIRMANPSASAQSDGQLIFQTTSSGTLSEAMRINSSQRVLIGQTTARNSFFGNNVGTYNPRFQIEANNTSSGDRMVSFVLNDDSNNAFIQIFGRSRGTTANSLTAVAEGDNIGVISWQGATGNTLTEAAQIKAEVDGAVGSADMPGRLVFRTTADGTSSSTERMRITSGGDLLLGDQTINYQASNRTSIILGGNDQALVGFRTASANIGYFYGSANDFLMEGESGKNVMISAAGGGDRVITRIGGSHRVEVYGSYTTDQIYGMERNLGTIADGAAGYVLIARRDSGSNVNATGVNGMITVSRGSTGSFNIQESTYINAKRAYNNFIVADCYTTGNSYAGNRIVTLTYDSVEYYAIEFPTNSARHLQFTGWAKTSAGTVVMPSLVQASSVTGVAAYQTIPMITRGRGDTKTRFYNGDVVFSNGYGIDFSATAGGGTEIFNDYETGSWQPEIYYQNASDQAAATNTVQSGRYTKIGNLVTCAFRLDWNPPSSPANDNIGVKNFPFPGLDNYYNAQGVIVGTCSVAGIQLAQLSAGGTMALVLTTSGGGNLGDDFGNTSGRYIRGTITYHTGS